MYSKSPESMTKLTDSPGKVESAVDSPVHYHAACLFDPRLLDAALGLVVFGKRDELAPSAERRAGVAGVGDVVILIVEYQDVGGAASVVTNFILVHPLPLVLPADLIQLVVAFGRDQHFVHLVEVLFQGS